MASRQEVAFLNAGHHEAVLFHPDGARLYTFGRTGLRCWPLRPAGRGPGSLRVGPPELIAAPEVHGWFRGARSAEGRLVVAADHLDDRRDRLTVFPADRTAERTVLGDGSKLTRIAMSPDGRRVAAGQFGPTGVKVWDASTGRLEWSSACDQSYVLFSPDGEWLLAGGGGSVGYRVWKTGSWEPGSSIPRDRAELWGGQGAFRPDGRLLAVPRSLQDVQFLDFAARREIATLPAPDRACVDDWLCFSPDGSLLAVAAESHSVQLWDLGAIGGQLRALGLGCDLLPDSPDRPSRRPPPPVRVFQEVHEAEHLPVVDSTAGWGTYVQEMKRWGRHWSNDKQLHCGTLKGHFVELQVDVPETGHYRLAVCLSRSWNFGLVEVALDGRKIGGPFDGLHGSAPPTEKVEYGTFDLREGSHRLRFTAVDKNPKSADYFVGIDYVQLTPVDRPP